MYLNKLLFPAPHSHYDAKKFQDELLWVARQRNFKEFRIDRKGTPKTEEKKKPPLQQGSKFINLFNPFKHTKDSPKSTKIISALNLETGTAIKPTIIKPEIDIFPDKVIREQDINLAEHMIKFPQFECTKEDASMSPASGQISKKMSIDNNEECKKEDDKSKKKKKKNKAACLSFLPKTHKDKKITLELFDGTHVSPAFQIGVGPALRNLGPEIADAIIHRNKQPVDLEKDSSSDSEEETPNVPKKMVNIPCLYLKCRIPTSKTLMYFHGNAEDLNTSYEFLQNLSNNLLVNVVAQEYPGYGIYSGSSSEKKVLIDAETVYNHLLNELKISEENIFLFGRSIGSGPATWLASIKNPGMLILMSPFTSIRAVAKHLGGPLARLLVKERFKNLDFMKDVKCPVFIIHGKKDNLIPPLQAVKLYEAIKGKKKLYLAEEMTHSEFDFFGDISAPLTKWFKDLNLLNFSSAKATKENIKLSSKIESNKNAIPANGNDRNKND